MKLRSIKALSLAALANKLNERSVRRDNIQLISPEGNGFTALYWGNAYTAELSCTADDDFTDCITVEAPNRDAAFFAATREFWKRTPHPDGNAGRRYQNPHGWEDCTPDGEHLADYQIDIKIID